MFFIVCFFIMLQQKNYPVDQLNCVVLLSLNIKWKNFVLSSALFTKPICFIGKTVNIFLFFFYIFVLHDFCWSLNYELWHWQNQMFFCSDRHLPYFLRPCFWKITFIQYVHIFQCTNPPICTHPVWVNTNEWLWCWC